MVTSTSTNNNNINNNGENKKRAVVEGGLQKEAEKETLLPILDKTATIHTLMSLGDIEDDDDAGKEWEMEEDDEIYIMSDIEPEEEPEGVEHGAHPDSADFKDEKEVEEEEEGEEFESDEYSEGDAEMVIEDPFEPVNPVNDGENSGQQLEAISLDNIIPSGRRRNQQIY